MCNSSSVACGGNLLNAPFYICRITLWIQLLMFPSGHLFERNSECLPPFHTHNDTSKGYSARYQPNQLKYVFQRHFDMCTGSCWWGTVCYTSWESEAELTEYNKLLVLSLKEKHMMNWIWKWGNHVVELGHFDKGYILSRIQRCNVKMPSRK